MMRRARILHIIGTMDTGGAETFLINLLSRLNLQVYDSKVYYLVGAGSLSHRLREMGIPCEALGASGQKDILKLPKLLNILRRERPEVVHTYLHVANYWISVACRLAGVPFLVQSIQAMHLHHPMKLPVVRVLEQMNCKLATREIAVSEAVKRYVVDTFRVAPDKVTVIYNGVRADFAKANGRPGVIREQLGLSTADRVIGCVANLIPRVKGYEYLIPAFVEVKRQVAAAKLVIAGEGPLRADLTRTIHELGLAADVILLGRRPDVPDILSLMDVFVLASTSEGTPLALIEAMMANKPVVATRVGGIPELVQNGVTGILVPVGDVQALAEAIVDLVTDPERANRMATAGYRVAQSKFTIEKIAADVERLYANLLNWH